jgi:hypothetical protein
MLFFLNKIVVPVDFSELSITSECVYLFLEDQAHKIFILDKCKDQVCTMLLW